MKIWLFHGTNAMTQQIKQRSKTFSNDSKSRSWNIPTSQSINTPIGVVYYGYG